MDPQVIHAILVTNVHGVPLKLHSASQARYEGHCSDDNSETRAPSTKRNNLKPKDANLEPR